MEPTPKIYSHTYVLIAQHYVFPSYHIGFCLCQELLNITILT